MAPKFYLIQDVNNDELLTPNHSLTGSMIVEIRCDDHENRKGKIS